MSMIRLDDEVTEVDTEIRHYLPTLRLGSEGGEVHHAQYLLNRCGQMPPLKQDSVFGEKMLAAVKTFQHAHGLPPSGIIDARVWLELRRDTEPAPPLPPPSSPVSA